MRCCWRPASRRAMPRARWRDAALAPAQAIIAAILRAHVPNPALVVDRHWHMVAANDGVPPLLAGVADPGLLRPPVNVLRLSLHPCGLAPAIANLPVWRAHILTRLRRQAHASGDPALAALLAELQTLGGTDGWTDAADSVATPLELDTPAGRLSLISTTTVFGTPAEVTLSELAIEAFYPADDATAARTCATATGELTGQLGEPPKVSSRVKPNQAGTKRYACERLRKPA